MAVLSKVFRSGNSEAVRLPKEVAFGENVDVVIERTGDVLTIRRAKDPVRERERLLQLLADLQAIGPSDDGVQVRDPFEFPDRENLGRS